MYKVREENMTCRISHKMAKKNNTNFTINNIIMDIQQNHFAKQVHSSNLQILSKILHQEVQQIHTISTISSMTNMFVISIEKMLKKVEDKPWEE